MAIPVSTALGRRDRLWPAVLASAVLHAAIVVWAVARRPAPEIDLGQRPIVARLVRLGPKKPDEYLPRKEAAPPPAAAPAPAAAPVLPTATAPRKPAAPSPTAPPAKPAPSSSGRPGGTTLASVLSKVQREAAAEQQWGSPDGDPMGDSESGTEGDRYLALVYRELQANYVLPKTISESESLHLAATVILLLDANGHVAGHSFERRSGNAAYDDALERAIQNARLPPPPAALRERYRTQGLGVKFHVSP